MVTKLGQFTKLGHISAFLNCPNFVTIFCQVLKMEIIFFIGITILVIPDHMRMYMDKRTFGHHDLHTNFAQHDTHED